MNGHSRSPNPLPLPHFPSHVDPPRRPRVQLRRTASGLGAPGHLHRAAADVAHHATAFAVQDVDGPWGAGGLGAW